MNKKKHGMSTTLFYKVWQSMMQRCYNKNDKAYKWYGARGIFVSEGWHIFENFMSDMLPQYIEGLSLDRIDNARGYSKDNCRWTTSLEQNRNKRAKSSKYFLTYKGKTLSIQDWASITGTPYRTLLDRHKKWNWTDEEILIKAFERCKSSELKGVMQ